jgi:hypothetical protein
MSFSMVSRNKNGFFRLSKRHTISSELAKAQVSKGARPGAPSVCFQPRKIPAQAEPGRGTLENKMNATGRASPRSPRALRTRQRARNLTLLHFHSGHLGLGGVALQFDHDQIHRRVAGIFR